MEYELKVFVNAMGCVAKTLLGQKNPVAGVRIMQPYLYRAVDSDGNTLDFLLTTKRDTKAAKRFFRKALKAIHTQNSRVITVDKNAA